MKTKMAFIALALFAGQAQAEWESIGGSSDYGLYIDMTTKRRDGNYTLVWAMFDYYKTQTVAGDKYKTLMSLLVFKCDEMIYGHKTDVYYSDNMGKGDYLGKAEMEGGGVNYENPIPGTVGMHLVSLVCNS